MLSDSIYDLAIETARSSTSKKQVGAILLNKSKVVVTATNIETKSHPLQARFAERVGLHEKIFLHAEIAALVKCREVCDTIVVARLGGHNHDELRMAKPCPVCSLALKEAGIHKIHYTTDQGFLYEYGSEITKTHSQV
jgi:tRNA(Arg) A34 adenosine deaminase TadA